MPLSERLLAIEKLARDFMLADQIRRSNRNLLCPFKGKRSESAAFYQPSMTMRSLKSSPSDDARITSSI